jgi:subtilisin-like proprotein convertase family protein
MPMSTRAVRGAVLCLSMFLSLSAGAVEVHSDRTADRVLPTLRVVADELEATPALRLDAQRAPLMQGRVGPFLQRFGAEWKLHWDARSDRPNLVQGQGIALLPGRGNALTPASVGLAVARAVELDDIEAPARRLIAELDPLLNLGGIELRLDRERSVPFGDDRSHWFLEFGQYHDGLRVDGAFVFLRVAQGNVVQFGAERVAPVKAALASTLDRTQAFDRAWSQLAFPAGTRVAETLEAGELRVYPVLPPGEMIGEEYVGLDGEGYAHRYGWRFVFRVDGDPATWQVLLDANSGEVFDLRDLNVHADATVRGGVYPTTNTDPEISVTFPFAAVSNGGVKVTNINGVYDYTGGAATTSLDGQYFRMSDACGAISLSNSTTGNLDLGSSGGTDCVTPGFGGAGNTHASRTGFYHLTLINTKARAILPTNTWLQGKVVANMNVNDVCNAGWNGTSVSFFRSGSGCSNTGELAAVFLHEWGHGMDTNSGGSASENASGEAVGDTFAFLETRDSCIGPNFRPGVPCFNCTSCTGVRDVEEFSTRGPPTRTVARPNTVTSDTGINCDRFACPYSTPTGFPYRGPMGYQGHCESHISSGANWDLTQSLVDRHGEDGWQRMDRIWYSSLVPSKSAYRVNSGGTCNAAASVDGCGATNWYTVFLAADDDDGNLANGTPDACRIWDAFDSHGIACGERPVCTDDGPDFTLAVSGSPQRVCAGTTADFDIAIGANAGFANPVTLNVTGLPGASTAQFSPNPVTPVGTSDLSVAVDAGVASGSYVLAIQGSADASAGRSRNATLQVDAAAPTAVALASPASNAIGVSTNAVLNWQAVPGAVDYAVEVASDVGFTDIVASATNVSATTWTAVGLEGGAPHYWRVRASNTCGVGLVSSTRAFTTASGFEVCRTPSPAIAIPDNNPAGVNDVLALPAGQSLANLRLKLQVNHSYVGDLVATLTRNTTTVTAIDRPGSPATTNGCTSDNIDVTLDDTAATPVEGVCSATPPAIAGVLRPNNPISAPFAGADPVGNWTLNVSDRVNADVGTIVRWCLESLTSVPTYGVGGSVDGLTGAGLVLQLNDGEETLAVAADGNFQFISRLRDLAAYEVEIQTQPAGAACEVREGSGAIAGADIGSVEIVCGVSQYTVSGVLNGLQGGEIDLTLNDSQTVTLAADGSFSFPTPIDDGSAVEIELTRQSEYLQRCTLSGASATMAGANYDALRVDCEALTIGVFADGFDP